MYLLLQFCGGKKREKEKEKKELKLSNSQYSFLPHTSIDSFSSYSFPFSPKTL